jgi:6-phosphogluconolactonase
VTSYGYEAANGSLVPMQVIPTLSQSFTGDSRASEIEVSADGRFIYASNRGYASVAIFAADPATGFLWTVDIVRTGDKTSRFFALAPDSGFMFVGHEDSDTIAAFTVDQETDRIAATDNMISTRGPVCIVCSAEWSCLRQCFVRAPQSPSRTFGSAASVMCLGSSSSECIR